MELTSLFRPELDAGNAKLFAAVAAARDESVTAAKSPPVPLAAGPFPRTLTASGDDKSALGTYQQAVLRIQGRVAADHALQHTPDANGLVLRPTMASVFLSHPKPTGKGTVILFHGYTAGPWQYPQMAQRFYDAGFNVYVPRLPGHGMATAQGMPTGAEMPKSYQRSMYDQFVDQVYGDTSALGEPVYGVGLSGGADLAMDMAVRHPQVKGVAAMSPYMGANPPSGWIFDFFLAVNPLTGGLLGRLLDHIPYQKNSLIPGDPTPHTKASFGSAMAMLEVGRELPKVPCPVQFLSTPGDFLAGSQHIDALFKESGGTSRDGWFQFAPNLHVPHAMVSPLEDTVPGAAQRVSDIVFNFVAKSQRTNQGVNP